MKVIVDANIAFSALLNVNSTIADILFNSSTQFEFLSPEFLIEELNKHRSKICQLGNLNKEEFDFLLLLLTRIIQFVEEESIDPSHWEKAFELTSDIDEKDTPYIALALKYNAGLWTGDQKLIKGLKSKGYSNFINTSQLVELRNKGD